MQGFNIVETESSSLDRLWVRGGFPLSYLADTEENSITWRESFVIEQILRNNFGTEYYFWSTYSGAELDLSFIHKGKQIGVEVKFTGIPKPTKSMHSALKDLNLERVFIIYPGSERYPLHDLIEACPLTDFIKLLQE